MEEALTLLQNPAFLTLLAVAGAYTFCRETPCCPVCKCAGTMDQVQDGPFPKYSKVYRCSYCGALYDQDNDRVYYSEH